MTDIPYQFAAAQHATLPTGDGTMSELTQLDVLHDGRVVGRVILTLGPRHSGSHHGFGVGCEVVAWDDDLTPRRMGFRDDMDNKAD